MANWCSNRVAFAGDSKAIMQIQQVFQNMKDKQGTTGIGQLPDFLDNEEGYLFDLYWDEADIGIFEYETRWAPNTEVVKAIAVRCGAGFVQEYAETGCLVYGQVTYREGVLSDTCLDWDDFDAYYYDEEQGVYVFEEEHYESDLAILDILLARKVAQRTT